MQYTGDILFYLSTYIIAALFLYNGLKVRSKKQHGGIILMAIGILIPSIIAGIRYGVGADYYSYLGMYTNVVEGKRMYFRAIEPASTLIIQLSAFLHSSFYMFFCFNLISNVCVVLAFNKILRGKTKYATYAYFIYLCIMYSTTLFVIRSATASAIIALAVSYIIESPSKKNIVKSLALSFIAFLFHKTAIIAILFYPAFIISGSTTTKSKTVRKLIFFGYILASISAPLIYNFASGFIKFGDYSRYLSKIGESFSIPTVNILMSIPIVIGLFLLGKNLKNEKTNDDRMLQSLTFCALQYIPLSIIVGWLTLVGATALSRLSLLLEPLIYCLMAYIPCYISNRERKYVKAIIIATFVVIVGLMFVRNLFWSDVLPYRTIFQGEVVYASKV